MLKAPDSSPSHSENNNPRDPFFIVGFQRSGTTLLRMMLNAHPEIAIPHDSAELWFKYREHAQKKYHALHDPSDVQAMIDDLLEEPRIKAWQSELPREMLLAEPLPKTFPDVMRRFHEVYAKLHEKQIWGDKNTGTLVALDQLNADFPACTIIHLVRDGRDCALSHMSKEYIYGYENTLRVASEWRDQVTLCHKMGAMLPQNRYLELRYEDLIAEPETQLRKISAFLGVNYSPEMLNYYQHVDENVPEDKRGLWPLLNKPPVASNIYKWKSRMKPADRAIFERNAGDLLREFGYETLPQPVREGRLREVWYHVHQRIAWRFK